MPKTVAMISRTGLEDKVACQGSGPALVEILAEYLQTGDAAGAVRKALVDLDIDPEATRLEIDGHPAKHAWEIQQELHQGRQAAADARYEAHDFGAVVGAASGWETVTPGDEWTRSVFLEPPAGSQETESTRVTFVVRFESGTATVAEAYVSG